MFLLFLHLLFIRTLGLRYTSECNTLLMHFLKYNLSNQYKIQGLTVYKQIFILLIHFNTKILMFFYINRWINIHGLAVYK